MIIHDVKQGSMEWFQLRLGKVTGSRLCKVFKADNLSLMDELIAEDMTETWEDSGYISDEMQRGIDLEPEALDQYEKINGVKLIRHGMIQSSEMPRLSYSPDGRVGVIGGVEVKCPTSKKHIQYLRQQQLPNDYRWQVLTPFLINPDCLWYDFMSYDPRVSQRPYFIHRTNRNEVEAELAKAKSDLEKFFAKMQKYQEEILFPTSKTVAA